MKRCFLLAGLSVFVAFSSCNKEEVVSPSAPEMEQTEASSFEYDGVTFTVSCGCPFQTKAKYADMEFTTINAEALNKEDVTLVIGSREVTKDVSQDIIFDVEGEALLELFISEDEIASVEQIVDDFEVNLGLTDGEYSSITQGLRKPGEKYTVCVKRVYHEFLEKTNEMLKQDGPITYLFRDTLDEYIGAAYAIIMCNEYE